MENFATKEEMIQEAIERMHILKMHSNPIKELEKQGLLNRSDVMFMGGKPFPGILYWVDGEENNLVEQIEESGNCLVYHVLRNFYEEIGRVYTFLLVTKDKDEWELDKQNLKENGYAYCAAHTDQGFEYGTVVVAPANGGVERVY